MSSVGSSSSVRGASRSVFLSLWPDGRAGRKSATAAAIRRMSQPSNSCAAGGAQLGRRGDVDQRDARGGARSAAFAATSVTCAPRAAARAASAKPIRPEERFPMYLTLSIGSRVPPAVTSTRTRQRAAAWAPAEAAASALDGGEQLRRLGQPADAPLAVRGERRLRPGGSRPDAALGERREVGLCRRVQVHAVVHRRRDEHRAGRGERRGA